MLNFSGSGVAMVTPFTNDGINYDATEKLIEHIIKGGTDALFVLGTTGEPSTMTRDEKISLLKFAIQKVNKRIPVFAGSGGNNTAEVIAFSKECESLGADGLLIVTPYYNKCTQNGCVAHYKAISDSVNIPIVAYNVPGRTGFNLLPETAAKLADIKNVVAIKEASGNIDQIIETIRLTKGKLNIVSGDDAIIVPAMSMGAKGVISVAANVVPDIVHKITDFCDNGDYKSAADLQLKLAPFVKALFKEVNPIPVKAALNLIGINAGLPRLPLTEIENGNLEILKTELKNLGVK